MSRLSFGPQMHRPMPGPARLSAPGARYQRPATPPVPSAVNPPQSLGTASYPKAPGGWTAPHAAPEPVAPPWLQRIAEKNPQALTSMGIEPGKTYGTRDELMGAIRNHGQQYNQQQQAADKAFLQSPKGQQYGGVANPYLPAGDTGRRVSSIGQPAYAQARRAQTARQLAGDILNGPAPEYGLHGGLTPQYGNATTIASQPQISRYVAQTQPARDQASYEAFKASPEGQALAARLDQAFAAIPRQPRPVVPEPARPAAPGEQQNFGEFSVGTGLTDTDFRTRQNAPPVQQTPFGQEPTGGLTDADFRTHGRLTTAGPPAPPAMNTAMPLRVVAGVPPMTPREDPWGRSPFVYTGDTYNESNLRPVQDPNFEHIGVNDQPWPDIWGQRNVSPVLPPTSGLLPEDLLYGNPDALTQEQQQYRKAGSVTDFDKLAAACGYEPEEAEFLRAALIDWEPELEQELEKQAAGSRFGSALAKLLQGGSRLRAPLPHPIGTHGGDWSRILYEVGSRGHAFNPTPKMRSDPDVNSIATMLQRAIGLAANKRPLPTGQLKDLPIAAPRVGTTANIAGEAARLAGQLEKLRGLRTGVNAAKDIGLGTAVSGGVLGGAAALRGGGQNTANQPVPSAATTTPATPSPAKSLPNTDLRNFLADMEWDQPHGDRAFAMYTPWQPATSPAIGTGKPSQPAVPTASQPAAEPSINWGDRLQKLLARRGELGEHIKAHPWGYGAAAVGLPLAALAAYKAMQPDEDEEELKYAGIKQADGPAVSDPHALAAAATPDHGGWLPEHIQQQAAEMGMQPHHPEFQRFWKQYKSDPASYGGDPEGALRFYRGTQRTEQFGRQLQPTYKNPLFQGSDERNPAAVREWDKMRADPRISAEIAQHAEGTADRNAGRFFTAANPSAVNAAGRTDIYRGTTPTRTVMTPWGGSVDLPNYDQLYGDKRGPALAAPVMTMLESSMLPFKLLMGGAEAAKVPLGDTWGQHGEWLKGIGRGLWRGGAQGMQDILSATQGGYDFKGAPFQTAIGQQKAIDELRRRFPVQTADMSHETMLAWLNNAHISGQENWGPDWTHALVHDAQRPPAAGTSQPGQQPGQQTGQAQSAPQPQPVAPQAAPAGQQPGQTPGQAPGQQPGHPGMGPHQAPPAGQGQQNPQVPPLEGQPESHLPGEPLPEGYQHPNNPFSNYQPQHLEGFIREGQQAQGHLQKADLQSAQGQQLASTVLRGALAEQTVRASNTGHQFDPAAEYNRIAENGITQEEIAEATRQPGFMELAQQYGGKALDMYQSMSPEQQTLIKWGVGLSASGLLSALFGQRGFLPWLLGALGIGAMGAAGAGAGLFGEQAQGLYGQGADWLHGLMGGQQNTPATPPMPQRLETEPTATSATAEDAKQQELQDYISNTGAMGGAEPGAGGEMNPPAVPQQAQQAAQPDVRQHPALQPYIPGGTNPHELDDADIARFVNDYRGDKVQPGVVQDVVSQMSPQERAEAAARINGQWPTWYDRSHRDPLMGWLQPQ